MHSFRDLLKESQETGVAIGHFNISELGFIESGVRRCPTAKRAGLGWFVRRRT
jgi:hypothetical protein